MCAREIKNERKIERAREKRDQERVREEGLGGRRRIARERECVYLCVCGRQRIRGGGRRRGKERETKKEIKREREAEKERERESRREKAKDTDRNMEENIMRDDN